MIFCNDLEVIAFLCGTTLILRVQKLCTIASGIVIVVESLSAEKRVLERGDSGIEYNSLHCTLREL